MKIWKGLTLQTLFGLRYVNSTNYQWADERSYYIAGIRGYDYGTVIPNGEEEKKSKSIFSVETKNTLKDIMKKQSTARKRVNLDN